MPAPASNGIATASDVNMDVAYDKLKLHAPGLRTRREPWHPTPTSRCWT